MTSQSNTDTDKVWEMMKQISICMLTTYDGKELRSRPMGAYLRRDDNTIYFLTDVKNHKDDEIQEYPHVNCAFANASSQNYVSLTGRAVVTNDRIKIKELWGPIAKAWWSSPDDPNIRLLKVTPIDAEYWDSPGTIVSYVKMFAAAVTDTRPTIGENKKVAL